MKHHTLLSINLSWLWAFIMIISIVTRGLSTCQWFDFNCESGIPAYNATVLYEWQLLNFAVCSARIKFVMHSASYWHWSVMKQYDCHKIFPSCTLICEASCNTINAVLALHGMQKTYIKLAVWSRRPWSSAIFCN